MSALKIFIGIALVLIFISSVVIVKWSESNTFLYQLLAIISVSLMAGGILINLNLHTKLKILILLIISLLIRVWWILNVNSVPVSDFNTMYLSAKEMLNGNLSAFRDFGYLSRFPHLICTTLYMALMIIIFPTSHLFAIKIVNVLLSVLTVFLLYKLAENFVKHEKVRLVIMLLASVFPAFISYSSTYCTENIAIPLYLITTILFYDAIKTENLGKWFLVGVLLSLSNMFRGVGIVFLIAFCIYIFVFTKNNKFKNSFLLITGMLFTSIFVSLFLISVNITDKPLWQGAEPSFATLLLKGTNVENGGRWNLEDAHFVDENLGKPDLVKKCIDIAISRISELSFTEKIEFFGEKFLSQWSVGDFSGTYWAFLETDMKLVQVVPFIFQVVFVVVIFFSAVSLFTRNTKKETMLIYILLVGFGLMFMVIETQSRYSYIISWAFLILAGQGIENMISIIRRVRNDKKVFENTKL